MTTTLLQLQPALPMVTPRGRGYAIVLIDYGMEEDLCWVVALDNGGQVWTYRNRDVRLEANTTLGRQPDRAWQAQNATQPPATRTPALTMERATRTNSEALHDTLDPNPSNAQAPNAPPQRSLRE